jgi:hypothetical protein
MAHPRPGPDARIEAEQVVVREADLRAEKARGLG